jgi:hypothetical protein
MKRGKPAERFLPEAPPKAASGRKPACTCGDCPACHHAQAARRHYHFHVSGKTDPDMQESQ